MNDSMTFQMLIQITQLVGAMPELLVLFAAAVVCLRRLSTCPRDSWLIGGAIALLLFARFGVSNLVTLLFQFLPGFVSGRINNLWILNLLYGLPMAVCQALAWGMILYTAFGEGSGSRSKYLIESGEVE